MAEADRYIEPGIGRFQAPSAERYQEPGQERFDPVERDRAEAARARALRMQQFIARGRGKSAQTIQKLEQVQKLVKQAKNFKTIFTIIGGLTSLTIIGIIWTFVQWNVQTVWTIFGLPGKEWIGMPWWFIPVVLLIDFLLFIVFCTIMLIGYFYANPKDVICAVSPEMVNQFATNGFLKAIGGIFARVISWVC